MRFTDEQITDFIRIWKEAFNEDIDRGFAVGRAHELVELYKMIGRLPPTQP